MCIKVCVCVCVYWLTPSRAAVWLKHLLRKVAACPMESRGHSTQPPPPSYHCRHIKGEKGARICFLGLLQKDYIFFSICAHEGEKQKERQISLHCLWSEPFFHPALFFKYIIIETAWIQSRCKLLLFISASATLCIFVSPFIRYKNDFQRNKSE